MLNLPCIHLDRFYWQPGWREASPEDFRSRVFAALDEDPRGWIVDGNYTRVLGTRVYDEATDVICECHRALSLPLVCLSGRAQHSHNFLPLCQGSIHR